jgi:hypothetical protein
VIFATARACHLGLPRNCAYGSPAIIVAAPELPRAARDRGADERKQRFSKMQRGRKSPHDLPLSLAALERPLPPLDLRADEKLEWEIIVHRLPADWFVAEMFPLLANLCRHICFARNLAIRINRIHEISGDPVALVARLIKDDPGLEGKALAKALEEWLDREERFCRMHLDQTKQIKMLSVSLRLTKQSRYDPITARNAARGDESPRAQLWDS